MIGLVNNKFIIGKEEFYCLAAEMHYYRVHKRYWAICFERIKKAGYTMLSTSVPWNLHEDTIGHFDFAGVDDPRKDLTVFLELAREFGFKVILRCGPYIGAGVRNGGIPDFIFADNDILARDPQGNPLKARAGIETSTGFVPSYLHPKYINHTKRFFMALVEAIQNYIYPKGPVFLMHIDEDLSAQGNSGIFDGDYSNFTINEKYISYLETKYKDIKDLNLIYGRKFKKFSEVEAPKSIEAKKVEDLRPYLDWVEFKESTVTDYVKIIRERLESLGVGALFSTSVSMKPCYGMPIRWKDIIDTKVTLGLNLELQENYHQISRSVRYLSATSDFSWAPKLLTGMWASDPKIADKYAKIENRSLRFLIVTALASGIKGLVSYMFVERDHWYGSPLGEDGTVRDNYEMMTKLNEAIPRMKLENLHGFAQVGVAYDRSILRYKYLGINEPCEYLNHLMDYCLPGICRGLGQLNYDYAVPDTEATSFFKNLRLTFVPSAEFMPDDIQEQLAEILRNGANLVFIGIIPKYNEMLRPSQVLAKFLGISTNLDWGFGKVQVGSESYDTQFFGSIAKKNSAWRIFAKSGNRIVGASRKIGKGMCYVLTFDPGLTYDPNKTQILQKFLANHKITTPVYSSEPDVDIIAQSDGLKTTAIYVINHNQRNQNSCPDNLRRVVMKVDPSLIGSSGSVKMKLVNLLNDEIIPTTAKELTEGLFIEIENMDSKIYLIEKR